MGTRKLRRDSVSYNSMISCCERGAEWNRALELFQVGCWKNCLIGDDGLDVVIFEGNSFFSKIQVTNSTSGMPLPDRRWESSRCQELPFPMAAWWVPSRKASNGSLRFRWWSRWMQRKSGRMLWCTMQQWVLVKSAANGKVRMPFWVLCTLSFATRILSMLRWQLLQMPECGRSPSICFRQCVKILWLILIHMPLQFQPMGYNIGLQLWHCFGPKKFKTLQVLWFSMRSWMPFLWRSRCFLLFLLVDWPVIIWCMEYILHNTLHVYNELCIIYRYQLTDKSVLCSQESETHQSIYYFLIMKLSLYAIVIVFFSSMCCNVSLRYWSHNLYLLLLPRRLEWAVTCICTYDCIVMQDVKIMFAGRIRYSDSLVLMHWGT